MGGAQPEGGFGVDGGEGIGNAVEAFFLVNGKEWYCRWYAHFQFLDSARIEGQEAVPVAYAESYGLGADSHHSKEEETHLRPWRLEQRQVLLQWQ